MFKEAVEKLLISKVLFLYCFQSTLDADFDVLIGLFLVNVATPLVHRGAHASFGLSF